VVADLQVEVAMVVAILVDIVAAKVAEEKKEVARTKKS
jgi:hypothetical protein